MANKESSTDPLKCSFCGKSQKQVIKLIAGPGVYICDECIELCVEIVEEEKIETKVSQFGWEFLNFDGICVQKLKGVDRY